MYVRLLGELKPRTFVAENVSGLVKGVAKGYFLEILAALKACGYLVEVRLLDAQWLGVPQARQRVVFVGVRADLVARGFAPAFPDPLPYRYSVRDALPWLSSAIHDQNGAFKSSGEIINKVAPTITNNPYHYSARDLTGQKINGGESVPETVGASMDGYAIGDEYDKLNPGQQSDRFFSLVRPDLELPCPTITAGGGGGDKVGAPGSVASVAHPTERRKFAIIEVKRLCGFPDDFILKGSYGQAWERLGNSVPPVMMFHVASAIRDRILLPSREQCLKQTKNGSGPKSRSKARTIAGRGKPAKTTAMALSESAAKSSEPTSSRSKKN